MTERHAMRVLTIGIRQYRVSIISSSEILAAQDIPYLPILLHQRSKKKLFSDKTIKIASILLLLSVSALAVVALGVKALPPVCISMLTSRGTLTTAAVDQTTGTIDASGCDIGDYIHSSISVSGLVVHDANQYGIFVDSGGLIPGAITVSISGVTVSSIGAHTGPAFTPNGVQTGIGIIFDSGAGGPVAQGSVDGSTVYGYQKGGIEANHNSNVTATNNVVTGLGHVDFIAQNGIEYARDAVGVIQGNTVSANFYTGHTGVLGNGLPCGSGSQPACPPGRQYVSCGILLVLIDPNKIQRGQNDLNASPPDDNQRNFAVVTDAITD
jgi:hypothetical protein